MHLILQSPIATHALIQPLAELVKAREVTAIAPHAYRCEHVSRPSSEVEFDRACHAAGLDYAFVDGKRSLADFKLLAMDMDSTVITIECIDEIADMQGLKPQVAAITEAAMRGEIAFPESLARRVALLEGLDASALQKVFDERLRLSPGVEQLVEAVRAAGLKTLLVSGGFTFFADRVQERLGMDVAHSNTLEIVGGKLTGRVLGTVVDATEKRATVERLCRDIGCSSSQAIVIGDGANDLEMMGIAGLSVAYRAKPVVRDHADIALNFSPLDAVLNVLAN